MLPEHFLCPKKVNSLETSGNIVGGWEFWMTFKVISIKCRRQTLIGDMWRYWGWSWSNLYYLRLLVHRFLCFIERVFRMIRCLAIYEAQLAKFDVEGTFIASSLLCDTSKPQIIHWKCFIWWPLPNFDIFLPFSIIYTSSSPYANGCSCDFAVVSVRRECTGRMQMCCALYTLHSFINLSNRAQSMNVCVL